MDKSYFEINEEIQRALKYKKPVVALESTLISHGLPYPKNLNVAKSSIDAVPFSTPAQSLLLYSVGEHPTTSSNMSRRLVISLSSLQLYSIVPKQCL